MKRFCNRVVFAGALACAVGAGSGSACAGDLPRVAICAAASNTTTPEMNTRFTDARDKLLATGFFESVGLINPTRFGVFTPSLEMLQEYDALLVWSNDSFDDAVAMGNVLADYVDAGGGVVVAVFANTSTNAQRFLQGRWQTGDYIAIPQMGGFSEGPGNLGTVLVPDHPIMEGVTTFVTRWGTTAQGIIFGGYRPNEPDITPGSTKIALWNTGQTLIATAPNPRVVELGFHPVSSDVNGNAYWDAATDGARIMANALLFTIPKGAPCPADLDGDGAVGSSDLAILLGSWGMSGGAADLDEDGVVGSGDLALMLGTWGGCA